MGIGVLIKPMIEKLEAFESFEGWISQVGCMLVAKIQQGFHLDFES